MPTLMSMASLESVPVEPLSDPLEILAATLGLDHYLWFLATSLPLKLTALKTFLPVFNLYSYFHWACPRRSPHCGTVSLWQGSGNYHIQLFLLFPAIQGPTSFKHLPGILIFTSFFVLGCLLIILLLKQGLILHSTLVWNLPYNLDWPWTPSLQ